MYARIFFVGFLFCNVALFSSSQRQPLLTQSMDRGAEVVDVDVRYVQAYNKRRALLDEHAEFIKNKPDDCFCSCCYPSGDTYNPSNTFFCIPWTCIHQPTKEELVNRLDISTASMIKEKNAR